MINKKKAYLVSTQSCKKLLNSHGFRLGRDLSQQLEVIIITLLCVGMRNCRRYDKNNNSRITVYKRDIPEMDSMDISPSKREIRLKRQVERLEEKLRKYESFGLYEQKLE